MAEKQTYSARKALYLSILDPVTFERQAMLNKLYLFFIVILAVGFLRLGWKFSELEQEIAVRRATANTRVQQYNERMRQDSLQRVAWELAKSAMLAAKKQDSLLNQIRSR